MKALFATIAFAATFAPASYAGPAQEARRLAKELIERASRVPSPVCSNPRYLKACKESFDQVHLEDGSIAFLGRDQKIEVLRSDKKDPTHLLIPYDDGTLKVTDAKIGKVRHGQTEAIEFKNGAMELGESGVEARWAPDGELLQAHMNSRIEDKTHTYFLQKRKSGGDDYYEIEYLFSEKFKGGRGTVRVPANSEEIFTTVSKFDAEKGLIVIAGKKRKTGADFIRTIDLNEKPKTTFYKPDDSFPSAGAVQ